MHHLYDRKQIVNKAHPTILNTCSSKFQECYLASITYFELKFRKGLNSYQCGIKNVDIKFTYDSNCPDPVNVTDLNIMQSIATSLIGWNEVNCDCSSYTRAPPVMILIPVAAYTRARANISLLVVHKHKQQTAIETINLWIYEQHQHVHARAELFRSIFSPFQFRNHNLKDKKGW